MFTRIPVPERRHVLPRLLFGYEDMDPGVFFRECVVVPGGQADAPSAVTETAETGVSFTRQSGGSEKSRNTYCIPGTTPSTTGGIAGCAIPGWG
jgi:hypothetical protein